MDNLGFQSLIGIRGCFHKKRRSKRQCIHGYSFQSLIGIKPVCFDANTDAHDLCIYRVAQLPVIELFPKRG